MKYLPMLEQSFTHYHWQLAERVLKDTNHKIIRQISIVDFNILLLSVFPDGNTFLHMIANINEILKIISDRVSDSF